MGCSCCHPRQAVVQVAGHSDAARELTEAREGFRALLDRVEAYADVTVISRRNARSAAVMSLDTDNSLIETIHLLGSPANAARLQLSLAQAERGDLVSKA